jgi:hypothetical protein
MKRLIAFVLCLSVLSLACTLADAQITITQTDMQNVLLNSQWVDYYMSYAPPPTVSLGVLSGSMQTFDFSTVPTPDSRDTTSMNFVDPTGQPGASNFPASNLCTPVLYSPFAGATLDQVSYFRLQSDGLYALGVYSHQSFPPFIDTVIVQKYSPLQLVFPLPLTYGTNRTGVDTMVSDSINNDYTVTTTTISCDGWGDLTVPSVMAPGGAPKTMVVSCLRATQTQITESYSAGTFSFREKTVNVNFLSKDGIVLTADQPDTNYTGGNAELTDLVSPAVPEGFALSQNYPNPFNPSTTISFDIPSGGHVTLKVYDLLGRDVATLVDRQMSPGSYEATFDAAGLPSGMYICRIVSGSYVGTRKMNLLK